MTPGCQNNERCAHRRISALRRLVLAAIAIFIMGAPGRAHAFGYYCWDPACVIADQAQNVAEDLFQELATQFYLGYVDPIPIDPMTGMTETGGQAGFPPGSVIYDFEGWMIFDYFDNYIGAALLNMGQQFLHDIFQQTLAIGAFFDAKNQLETQLLYQELAAKAHKDYQPTMDMCTFGTAVRSIAAADFNSNQANFMMARHEQNREMQHTGTEAVEGRPTDRFSRLVQLENRFCQYLDNNAVLATPTTGLGMLCNKTAPQTPQSNTKNNDIDYMRTILLPRTLNIDFSDNTLTGDEQDVLAMSNNLYSHDLFDNIQDTLFARQAGQAAYVDVRSIVAKRSVAETSFNAIVGMKVMGSPDSSPTGNAKTAGYLYRLLDELGMPTAEIPLWLGDRPSYMATLEVLAKKIYQRPEFYTELYESPTNVKRRSVAMQAIGVMMDRDIYLSYMRSEQIMAVLLEAKLEPVQSQVINEMGRMSAKSP